MVEKINNEYNNELLNFSKNFTFNILEEWDYKKNNKFHPNLKITQIKPKSNKKIWWKCDICQQSWETTVRNRSLGSKCTICSNKQLCTGVNDFETKHPELLKFWEKSGKNPNPKNVLFSTSTVKIIWPCENGHFYPTTPYAINRNRKCIYCNGTKVLQGYNDLASKCPESLQYWNYDKNDKTPQEVRYGSNNKAHFKCPTGHQYSASINHFYNGRRCPFCASKKTDETNCFSNQFPLLINEWDYKKNNILPNEITPGYDKKVHWQCSKCNHKWEAYIYNRKKGQNCPKCSKGSQTSKGEKEILNFIIEQGVDKNNIKTHHMIKNSDNKKFEIDIYLPEIKTGIEFNGVYYHSEKFVPKNYHLTKKEACEENSIKLIQIWEDDWINKNNIVKKMILHKINHSKEEKIYARKTIVKKIEYSESNNFFKKNHIQGGVNSTLYIGLFDKENTKKLVAAMAIKKEILNNETIFNITRYATSQNVAGGFTKIIKFLEKNYNFDTFTTFSDNCISNGDLYLKNGFVKDYEIKPDYSYLIKGTKREHKFKYRKIKFKNDNNLIWKENLTECELAKLNKMLRVYDAGKIKWVKKITKQ